MCAKIDDMHLIGFDNADSRIISAKVGTMIGYKDGKEADLLDPDVLVMFKVWCETPHSIYFEVRTDGVDFYTYETTLLSRHDSSIIIDAINKYCESNMEDWDPFAAGLNRYNFKNCTIVNGK